MIIIIIKKRNKIKLISKCINIIKKNGIKGFLIKLINKILSIRNHQTINKYIDIENYFKNKDGLEIGGPSNFFRKKGFMPIYDIIKNLDCVNFSSSTVWTGKINQKEGFIIDGKIVGKQYILDAINLKGIEKNIYEFVLSSNNIEHIANPIKAIEEWLSVLKKEGILVIIAPRKESNFDHKRKIVTFEHLLNDYKNNIDENDLSHLEEILKFHDIKMDKDSGTIEEFKKRSLNNIENRCLHQHVFDLNVLKKIYQHFNLSILTTIQIEHDYVIIGKKS